VVEPSPDRSLRRLAAYNWEHRWLYALGGTFLFLTNWLTASIPGRIGLAIDALQAHTPMGPSVASVAAMGATIIVVRALSRIFFFNPGRDIEYRIRQQLFDKMMALQPAFYTTAGTGDLVTRATNDITYVRAMVGFAFMQTVNTAMAIPITAWKMAAISPKLTALSAVPVALGVVVLQLGLRQMFTLQRRNQDELGALSDHVLSSFQGISTIQGFVAEEAFVRRFDQKVDAWFSTGMKLTMVRAIFFPFLVVSGGLATFLLLYVGAPMALAGELSVGDIAAFAALLATLIPPLRSMGWMLVVWQRGRASWERIVDVLDAPVDRPEGEHGIVRPPSPGPRIEVKDLTFAYPDRPDRPVLQHVDVDIAAGSVVGVFGRTGSGKTTLLRLLARLLNPPRGTVLVDGTDILTLDLGGWREEMRLVPQRPFLFSETIAQNIALEDAPDVRAVTEVVEKAALDSDVESLQHGLETIVGERGIMLSGGQRQRTALARGLYHEASVIMLDDVLSAVDHVTEARLVAMLSAMERSGKTPTVIIVSQRLSALRHADQIVVLDKGAVVDRGTHSELVARAGIYQDTWRFQQEHKEPA
jgi:ATP-binding cassette subfamily B protein